MECVRIRASRWSERSRGSRASGAGPRALLGLVLLVLASCYARSFPLADAPLADAALSGEAPLGLVVGLRAGEEGRNVFHIRQGEVVERFAERLAEAGLFERVIHPAGSRTAAPLPLVIELEVRSRYDLHAIRNLAQDVAAGATLLLLQPLLPTTWDLEIGLELRVRGSDGRVVWEQSASDLHRFESDWLHPPEAALADWHTQAIEHALQKAIASLRARRAEWVAAGQAEAPSGGAGP